MAKGKRKKQARTRSSGRQHRKQRLRKSILIVCEGKKTEPIYFEALCSDLTLPLVEVVIESTGAGYLAVVNKALKERKSREREAKKQRKNYWGKVEFDEVWCVFDSEQVKDKPLFYQAVNKAQANGLKLAVSIPCFEYWYLLHFKSTTQPFANASEVIQALKRFITNYDKNTNVFNQLSDYTDQAIVRAKRLRQKHPDQDNEYPNPSTRVDELVEMLKKMSIESRGA